MADGSSQQSFGFLALPVSRLRPVDIAINHDRFAVGMHAANHPLTRHLREYSIAQSTVCRIKKRLRRAVTEVEVT